MPIENHSLAKEFPELKERIHELKVGDAHFARMFEEYDGVEHKIQHIEAGLENVADAVLEDLKKQRLSLKDKLFGMLKKAA